MNNYEQIIKQIVEASPSWEKDGGGVRGRVIAPILSGFSSSGGMAEFVPQQFNQNNNETVQRSAQDPVADLILGGGGGGAATPSYPFKLNIAIKPNTNPPEQEVVVTEGLVLYEPSFYAVVPETKFNMQVGYIYLKINSNIGANPLVELIFSPTATLQNANNIVYYLIGEIKYDNNQYSVWNEHLGVIYYKEANVNGVFLYWNVEDASWNLSTAPTDRTIMYWDDNAKGWNKIESPEDTENLYILGIQNNTFSWIPTFNCEDEA